MHAVNEFFAETHDSFTVYIVEQRFAVGRGNEYIKSFKGKENLLLSNISMELMLSNILGYLQKKVPIISELVKKCFSLNSPLGIVEAITTLSKLFSVHEHQVAGPTVIDPIIIQEDEIKHKYISQLISLYKSSALAPIVIIILKDNDFTRAKTLLSGCPHGTNVKMIRNSGDVELYKVINKGAEDVESFIDAYSRQCFSTCSRTKRDILLNEEWAENSNVKYFGPSILKIRANLLFDEKTEARSDIVSLTSSLQMARKEGDHDVKLINSFECMSRLFQVYCDDFGGEDIGIALELANDLNNEILLAHVYRYSFFLNNITDSERFSMLDKAQDIFTKNKIEDHAIYCMNNKLIQGFYTDRINTRNFESMQEKAINDVPGLVGMSIIYNNVGVAYLLCSEPVNAINCFEKGLDYSRDRIVQNLGLLSNKLIAKDYLFQKIEENEIRLLIKRVFDTLGTEKLPFIATNYIMNALSISLKQQPGIFKEFMEDYPIRELIINALTDGQMGSGSLVTQMAYLSHKYNIVDFSDIPYPSKLSRVSGKKGDFIQNYGLNPIIFHAWL